DSLSSGRAPPRASRPDRRELDVRRAPHLLRALVERLLLLVPRAPGAAALGARDRDPAGQPARDRGAGRLHGRQLRVRVRVGRFSPAVLPGFDPARALLPRVGGARIRAVRLPREPIRRACADAPLTPDASATLGAGVTRSRALHRESRPQILLEEPSI